MNQAFLLIGGNMGNREQNLERARSLVNLYCGKVIKTSSVYETAAWGPVVQPAFLNQALQIETVFTAPQLMTALLACEKQLGRIRNEKSGPRLIDMDLLFFNDAIIQTEALIVPHPRLHLRRFALEPMQEIAPSFVHPLFQKTISELLQACTDELAVQKI